MKILSVLFLLVSFHCYAQDSTKTYEPCNDPQLLRLADKDSLTDSEATLYLELRKMCDESKRGDYGPASQKSKEETIRRQQDERKSDYRSAQERVSDAMSFYYVIAAITLIGSLIYLFTL